MVSAYRLKKKRKAKHCGNYIMVSGSAMFSIP